LLFRLKGGRRGGFDARRGLCVVIFGHAFFEALNALGDIAHHVGKPPLAEQQQDEDADDQPMPDAETTHKNLHWGKHNPAGAGGLMKLT
jgi:hypothetical protein